MRSFLIQALKSHGDIAIWTLLLPLLIQAVLHVLYVGHFYNTYALEPHLGMNNIFFFVFS